jgi:hypothetical protein
VILIETYYIIYRSGLVAVQLLGCVSPAGFSSSKLEGNHEPPVHDGEVPYPQRLLDTTLGGDGVGTSGATQPSKRAGNGIRLVVR